MNIFLFHFNNLMQDAVKNDDIMKTYELTKEYRKKLILSNNEYKRFLMNQNSENSKSISSAKPFLKLNKYETNDLSLSMDVNSINSSSNNEKSFKKKANLTDIIIGENDLSIPKGNFYFPLESNYKINKPIDESSSFFFKYFGEENLRKVNELCEGMYRKNLENPNISDDLVTNLLVIAIVTQVLRKNKDKNNLENVLQFAFKKFSKLIPNTSEKIFVQRVKILIDRSLKEMKNENLFYHLSIKKNEEVSFENLIGTNKQLFCSICSTYLCNIHNIRDEANFSFDNPEIYKPKNLLHTYKCLIYMSFLSCYFGINKNNTFKDKDIDDYFNNYDCNTKVYNFNNTHANNNYTNNNNSNNGNNEDLNTVTNINSFTPESAIDINSIARESPEDQPCQKKYHNQVNTHNTTDHSINRFNNLSSNLNPNKTIKNPNCNNSIESENTEYLTKSVSNLTTNIKNNNSNLKESKLSMILTKNNEENSQKILISNFTNQENIISNFKNKTNNKSSIQNQMEITKCFKATNEDSNFVYNQNLHGNILLKNGDYYCNRSNDDLANLTNTGDILSSNEYTAILHNPKTCLKNNLVLSENQINNSDCFINIKSSNFLTSIVNKDDKKTQIYDVTTFLEDDIQESIERNEFITNTINPINKTLYNAETAENYINSKYISTEGENNSQNSDYKFYNKIIDLIFFFNSIIETNKLQSLIKKFDLHKNNQDSQQLKNSGSSYNLTNNSIKLKLNNNTSTENVSEKNLTEVNTCNGKKITRDNSKFTSEEFKSKDFSNFKLGNCLGLMNVQINKKNENEVKNFEELKNIKIKFCHFEILRRKIFSYHSYKNFSESISCGPGCFLKFLKLDPKLQEIIWNKFGNDNNLGEIKELYFDKVFKIFGYDPCNIASCFKLFDKFNKQDYEVSCFSIYFKLLNRIPNEDFKSLLDYSKNMNTRVMIQKRRNKTSLDTKRFKSIQEQAQNNELQEYYPCSHPGIFKCTKDNCPCFERGFCEKYCLCNHVLCNIMFKGCNCKSKCNKKSCPCYAANRECDKDICTNCCKESSMNDDKEIICENSKMQRKLFANCAIAKSDIEGWGLFARQDIKKGDFIMEYVGEIIEEDETKERDKWNEIEKITYLFTLNNSIDIDSKSMGNKLRFANHSKMYENCAAKVYFTQGFHKVGLFAIKDIQKYEEILFDYDGKNELWKRFPWIKEDNKKRCKFQSEVNNLSSQKSKLFDSKFNKYYKSRENNSVIDMNESVDLSSDLSDYSSNNQPDKSVSRSRELSLSSELDLSLLSEHSCNDKDKLFLNRKRLRTKSMDKKYNSRKKNKKIISAKKSEYNRKYYRNKVILKRRSEVEKEMKRKYDSYRQSHQDIVIDLTNIEP